MKRYIFKFREKKGFQKADFAKVESNILTNIVDVFENRAFIVESDLSLSQLIKQFDDDWLIGEETKYLRV